MDRRKHLLYKIEKSFDKERSANQTSLRSAEKILMQPNKKILALVAILVGGSALHAATVYNNGVSYSGTYLNPGANEVGDEIILAGTARIPNTFSFEYYGSNFLGANTFRVRFYLNNGAPLGNNTFLPNTVFYDSGVQTLLTPTPLDANGAGRNTFLLDISSITTANGLLPDRFTWSVQYGGVGAGETAGVSLYHPPSVGLSENDYWFNNGGTWQLRTNNIAGVPINFGALLSANVPEPATYVLAILGGICGFALVSRRKSSRP